MDQLTGNNVLPNRTGDLRETLQCLTVQEILAEMKGKVTLSRQERVRKELLIERICVKAAPEELHKLKETAMCKQKQAGTCGQRGRKRKRTACDSGGGLREPSVGAQETGSHCSGSRFLQLPTDTQLKQCYARFFKATSNAPTEQCTCAVCARECRVLENKVLAMPLSLIPNSERLVPRCPHTTHELYKGRLLEPDGLVGENDDPLVSVCGQCLEELNKPGHKPPKMSLANGLWIGWIPWPLQLLTFPEQLLIALLYPRVYVFKLFPKRQQGTRNMATLQRAMRGNVTTYELNAEAIASMVEGNLMPRPPAILASLISVTFIALGEVPKKWLHSTFHVRWQVVSNALQWLKVNNPKYYHDIEISPTRINTLPEDDVPEEITDIIRQSEDLGVLEEEDDSYVPPDDNEGQQFE